nr:hypothetical protein [Tanacetum cinerariifolium]
MFIKSRIYVDDEYVVMTRNYIIHYTQLVIPEFRDTLIQHMESVMKSIDESAHHKREYDNRVNERHMKTIEEKVDTSKALDASLVDIESSVTEPIEQDTSSRSRNDVHVNNAYIIPIYDEEPMAEKTAVVKPPHVIASIESRNSSKNMPRFSSNDMVYNHYLEEAKKKTQESGRNSRPSVMASARSQSTSNGSKPKPRSNTQTSRNWPASKSSFTTTKTVPIAEYPRNSRNFFDSKHFVCSTCQKCVFNTNHDSCVTKFLKEVNLYAKVPSNKTTNINKLAEQISVAKKPKRRILKGHRFSIKKTPIVHEKTVTHRSYLRWKPTGKIFKTVGLRWVPTGKIFNSSIIKADSTLNLSVGTSFNPKKEGLRAMTSDHNSSKLRIHDHNNELPSSKLVLNGCGGKMMVERLSKWCGMRWWLTKVVMRRLVSWRHQQGGGAAEMLLVVMMMMTRDGSDGL